MKHYFQLKEHRWYCVSEFPGTAMITTDSGVEIPEPEGWWDQSPPFALAIDLSVANTIRFLIDGVLVAEHGVLKNNVESNRTVPT